MLLALVALPARAETSLAGSFLAEKDCPALQSIRKATNPGNIALQPGTSYRIVAGNTTPPTHYWIVVPGAEPQKRWVAADCGTAELTGGALPPRRHPRRAAQKPGAPSSSSPPRWQPAFCEGQPKKPECTAQAAGSFETTHFSLHGLWPQPRARAYCQVGAADRAHDKAHDWAALPEPTLSRRHPRRARGASCPARSRRSSAMNGSSTAPATAPTPSAISPTPSPRSAALNASPVRDLFAQNIGKELSLSAIRAAFDTAFGDGAGQRVRVACEDRGTRRLITELTIGLSGTIAPDADLGSLIRAAAPTDGGCPGGLVDAVGLQ